MNKGKHVYCEKPMVHKLEEGAEVIATQKKTGQVFQVGSQRVSSIVTDKTREIFESKAIGDLVMVETWMDRHSANGAWQYSIPTDAQANTVDWIISWEMPQRDPMTRFAFSDGEIIRIMARVWPVIFLFICFQHCMQ